jgi:hypothetical protein
MAAPAPLPLLSARGVLIAAVLAVLLCWPMLLVTAPLGYFDSLSYVQTGERAVTLALDLLGLADPAGGSGAAAPAAAEAAGARQLRSFAYSAFVHLGAQTPAGLPLVPVLQTAATLVVLFALAGGPPARGPLAAAAALVLVGTTTTLPWFAAYLMPDILAAALLLYFALLAGRIDAVPGPWRLALAAFAAFAVVSHYGHLPLAAGLCGVVLALRAAGRRLTPAVAALGIVPILAAAAANLAASAVALNETSVAPKRLPILLARSIDDGPALWYLREACPEAGYTVCRVMPELPDDITEFLWHDTGIARATAAEMDAIRAEEATILWRAFLAYPAAQTRAFAGNVLRQLVAVGTGEVLPLEPDGAGGLATATARAEAYPALALFDTLTKAGTAAGAIALAALWLSGRTGRDERLAVAVCLAGILGNALIFGGLSAPVDRYQSRIVWILPALAALFWLTGPRPPPRRA